MLLQQPPLRKTPTSARRIARRKQATQATRAALGAALGALAVSVAPAPAQAQDAGALTPEQDAIMVKARAAYRDGSYSEAAKLYDEAVKAGADFNITYLNKGRALQRAGECDGAAAAYGAVLDARPINDPSPDTIRGALTRYQEQLGQQCPGELTVECLAPDVTLELSAANTGLLDDAPSTVKPQPVLCGQTLTLPSGDYTITATGYERETQTPASVIGTRAQKVRIMLAPPEVVVQTVEGDVDLVPIFGWSSLGFGALAVGSGVTFSVLLSQNNDRIDTLNAQGDLNASDIDDATQTGELYENLQWISYGLGAAGLVTGALLLVLDEPDEASGVDATTGPTTTLVPWVTPDAQGASAVIRF